MYEYFAPEVISNLNCSENEVFNYCYHHIKEVSEMKIQELADVCFVSKTTVVRMCQKLGFEGFTEYRYFLRKVYDKELERKKIVKGDIKKVREHDLNGMKQIINYDQLRTIAQLIKDKRINFFGKGLSELICEYGVMQFSLLDLHVTSFGSSHLARNIGKRMTREDVLIIVSASGMTPSVLEVANIVKRTEATIISITGVGLNPLSQLADITLLTVMSPDPRVDFDNASRISSFMLLEALIDAMIDELA